MAKRFTDSEKYKKTFFRGLPGAYKLLWDYLYHDCDNAGIWIRDFEIAQLYIGSDMPVTESQALKYFGDRIIVFDDGRKWFIPAYIEFQYECSLDDLNPKNNAHLSVIKKLKKQGLLSPSRGDKDKDKDKDMVKDKEDAWKELTTDDLLMEDARITISQKGWRSFDDNDILGAIRSFIAKQELPTPRDELRKYWRNWLFREKNEKLMDYGKNFKNERLSSKVP